MKKGFTASALALFTAFFIASSAAPALAVGDEGGEVTKEHIQKRTNRLKEVLGLTDQQTTSIQKVLEEMNEKSKALRKETNDRIDAILTPEQRAKFKEEIKQLNEKRKKMFEEAKAKAKAQEKA